jgi:acyl-CoA thioesterase-1
MYCIKIHLALLLAFTCCVQYSFANNTAESTKRLLILGDSLTAGYGLAAEEAFPAQLEEALLQSGRNVSVINAGVSGDTSAGGLARLDWALQDDPQMVIVALGGNDALRGLPPEETFANLDAILERLKVAGIHVILIGMKAPRNLGESYTTAFDQLYPRLAQKHNVGFYPFFLDGVALDPALNQNDGIHPNARGIALIVERILPLVESALMAMP